MVLTVQQKEQLKQRLVDCLKDEPEVRKIVVFGSFLRAVEPHDIDVAVFQDSDEKYLPLALRYRRKTRPISQIIPLDILPLRAGSATGVFMDEIARGETIYEK